MKPLQGIDDSFSGQDVVLTWIIRPRWGLHISQFLEGESYENRGQRHRNPNQCS